MRKLASRLLILAVACVLGAVVSMRAAETAVEAGSATCAGCHGEVAEKFAKTLHGRKVKSTDKLKAGCEACHGAGSLHAAAAGDKNNPGFATIRDPKKLDVAEQNEMCLSCHKDFKQVLLWKTSAHASAGVSCLKCHSVHSGEGRQSLAKAGSETCYQCHEKQKADMRLPSHHPIPEGKMTCTGCHNPHGGPLGNLTAETINETCYKCHSEKAGPFAFEHPPVVDDCLNCHTPHGSQNERLVKQPQPYLCLGCHKWPHQVRLAGVNPAITLKHLEQRGRCTDCHFDIHGSDHKAALKN